ncbi:MAG: hypothetical protein HKN85_08580, partial [Gammaproteobacteria bacterium]|nr:hypothetical protein [Gammaproteobacteria bacterium]
MSVDISLFHFLRPLWLAMLPVAALCWHFGRTKFKASSWESYLPKATVLALRVGTSESSRRWQWWMLASLLVLVIAAAGPTWSKQEVPIVKNQNALVVILDLSPSMLAEDLKPDRLTRAKYKLID